MTLTGQQQRRSAGENKQLCNYCVLYMTNVIQRLMTSLQASSVVCPASYAIHAGGSATNHRRQWYGEVCRWHLSYHHLTIQEV